RFFRSLNDARNHIVEPWAGYFRALADDPDFRQIEIAKVRRSMDHAIRDAHHFGFRSERGLSLMFEMVTQGGSGWLHVKDRERLIAERRAAEQQRLGRPLHERELMAIIANVVADTALPRWRENVRRRKMTIVNGTGRVHGRDWDLERDFGLT